VKYHLWTIGCQMNEADSRHLAARLAQAGYTACADARDADLVILNTCVVRQQAEDRAWARLRELEAWKKRRPDLKVALMGCLVGTRSGPAARLREQLAFVDYFLPPSDLSPLVGTLLPGETEGRSDDELDRLARDAAQNAGAPAAAVPAGSIAANVPVVLGCSHACTYCIIPYRRGGERSRPAADILAEVRALVAAGTREVMLLGQIVDRYGLDLPGGPDLADLLSAVARVEGLLRVRFLTSHPNHLSDRILDAVAAEPRICPHIEVPAQAGDDEVLLRMRRGYTVDDYRRLIARIRARLPEAAIHSDFIVGFPGETEAQFLGSLRLMEEVRFDKTHLSRYSERPETFAARRYPDDVPPEEKERRVLILENAQRAILAETNRRFLGATVSVLVESRDDKRGRWRGRTPLNRLVFFPDSRDLLGREVPVRIAWTGPFSMIGEAEDPPPSGG
jgi:tRNA-2-methylthio-N6-dimethylallyladenosine synthase